MRLSCREELTDVLLTAFVLGGDTEANRGDGSIQTCCCRRPSFADAKNLAGMCCQGADVLAGKESGTSASSSDGSCSCCTETCLKCVQTDGDNQPVTVLSGKVVSGQNEERVEIFVPSSLVKQGCSSSNNPCTTFQPPGTSILPALLLAFPPDKWSGILDEKLLQEVRDLVSIPNLPPLVQHEVKMNLFFSLGFILICRKGKASKTLSFPSFGYNILDLIKRECLGE